MKTSAQVSLKVQGIAGALSRMSINLWDKTILDFFWLRGVTHVCNTRTCTPKILYFHVFLEKGHLSLPAKGKKFMFSGEKKPSFQIIQERSCPSAALFEKTIFSGSLMKISYFRAFLQQRTV